MNEVAKVEQNQIEIVQKETLTSWLSIVGNKLEAKEQEQFLQIAQAFNLNPFKREIYCTAYGEGQYRQLSIITGYEVYLKRAELTGLLDGYETKTSGSVAKGDLKATCTIYRKDRKFPFVWEVPYSEYVQKKKDGTITGFWKDKPETMIKKVAISQAFRLCFPVEIGGMPYTADEMPDTQNIEVAEVVKEDKSKQQPQKTAKQIRDEKILALPEIAEQNGITDIADFAVFAGMNKDNPERKTAIDVYVSEPNIYLDTIHRYKDANELQIADQSNDLPF